MQHIVFLSYAHQDADFALAVEAALSSVSATVWRDSSSLRAGEKWPQVLAEAIQECGTFVLIWTASAVTSSFVENEWNVALALKKIIVPVVVDKTPLPAALRAFHAIHDRTPDSIAALVLDASAAPPLGITPESHGSVRARSAPSRARRPLALTALAVALAAAGVLAVGIDRWHRSTASDAEAILARQSRMAGLVADQEDRPVPGATITLLEPYTSTVTDVHGRFELKFVAPADQSLRVNVRKEGYEPTVEYFPTRSDLHIVLRQR